MNTKQTIAICLVIALGLVVWGNAGDLNPPGAPAPTMHTLDDIYDMCQSGVSSQPAWASWAGSIAIGTDQQIAAGAGVIHGIWLKQEGSQTVFEGGVRVYDGPPDGGASPIGWFSTVQQTGLVANQFYQLDAIFQNGLYVRGEHGPPYVTVLYQLDTQER